MKRFISVLCLFFQQSILYAQDKLPGFGKVDMADLVMKECSFDKGAEAVVLFDVAEVYCFLDLNARNPITTQFERHVRIKILNLKGLDQANIRIPYNSDINIEEIKNLTAQTFNLDAQGNIVISKLDKKMIFDKKINKRLSEMVFAFPDVRPGSIIEFKYKDEATNLYGLKRWYFQRSIPVKHSRYILNFPSEFNISAQPKGGFKVNMNRINDGNRNIKNFFMDEVPALRDEPFMSCDLDYLQQVVPFLISLDIPGDISHNLLWTWPGIVKQLMNDEDFGMQLKKNIPRTAELDLALKDIQEPYKRMELVHHYVGKQMEWNGRYGIWALDGVKSAWRDKKGTTGEINLILVNLLKDAGLEAYPLLVSTRDNGRINTAIAGFDQFNKVLAYVNIGNNNFILDATDKNTAVFLVPEEVLNSEGLLIKKFDTYEWGWKEVRDNIHQYQHTIMIDAAVDEKGMLRGSADISSFDYARLQRLPYLQEGNQKFIERYFSSNEFKTNIEDLLFENEKADSMPLIQKFSFSQEVNSSGGYNHFSANLFSGLEKNPFIADTRTSDIFFGANQFYSILASFRIPPGYSFETLPKNTRMRLPDTSVVFTRIAQVDDKTLSIRMELQFKKPIYANQEYDAFQEFYKKLYGLLNEQFVYKKD